LDTPFCYAEQLQYHPSNHATDVCPMPQDYPLSDLKVLDLSRVLAGPFAGRMLSDLGAQVVKVEPPDQDVTRHWGHTVGSISGYYQQQNAGKRNVSIDLRQPQGTQLLLDLACKADILLENFRPGVMARLGLDWDTLHRLNPRLIMLSISGFGQHGPESQRAAYAPIVHAETGAIQRQAEKADSYPVEMCMSFADTNAGLHGLVGLLAAVHQRHRTGEGQHIDIAMVDAMLATDDQTHYYLEGAPVNNGASEVWAATGGPVIMAGDFRHIWRLLNTVLGVQEPTPADATLAAKIAARRAATEAFLVSFRHRQALTAALDKANIAWGNVTSTSTYLQDSTTLAHRRSVIAVDDRHGGTRPLFQSPYRFSGASSGVRGGAPFQGEHNQAVLTEWLDYSASQISRLQAQQVLVSE
jgi:CoA:oxalate CoA-transferase